jgi:hypothetical protein
MAMKKLATTNVKLKVGASLEGYLLSKNLREIDGDDGKFDLCKITLKNDKLGIVTHWLQADYFHLLALGYMTKIEKVKTTLKDESGKETEGVRTDVSQDDTDRIAL